MYTGHLLQRVVPLHHLQVLDAAEHEKHRVIGINVNTPNDEMHSAFTNVSSCPFAALARSSDEVR